jgi:hypothetical protein
MILDGEVTKTKVVDIEKLCNFVVYKFLIWSRYDVTLFDSQDFIEVNTN